MIRTTLAKINPNYLSLISRALKKQHQKTFDDLKIVINNYSNAANNVVKADTPSSLAITEEFRLGLEEKLNRRNFKSLAYKQDEFNQVMLKLESPFSLFYLFEKYSNEFNMINLLRFTKKLTTLKKIYASDFFIPAQIKAKYTDLFIKHAPSFEPEDCFTTFKQLSYLGFNLNEYAVKACMQILKYQVNELKLKDIIAAKSILDKSPDLNEYARTLVKALTLAAQIKLDQIVGPNEAVRVLLAFHKEISVNNFENILTYLNQKFHRLELHQILDIRKVLETMNYTHVKFYQKAISNKTNITGQSKVDIKTETSIKELNNEKHDVIANDASLQNDNTK